MQRYPSRGLFLVKIAFALVCIGLLALAVVGAEAAFTHGHLFPLKVTGERVGP